MQHLNNRSQPLAVSNLDKGLFITATVLTGALIITAIAAAILFPPLGFGIALGSLAFYIIVGASVGSLAFGIPAAILAVKMAKTKMLEEENPIDHKDSSIKSAEDFKADHLNLYQASNFVSKSPSITDSFLINGANYFACDKNTSQDDKSNSLTKFHYDILLIPDNNGAILTESIRDTTKVFEFSWTGDAILSDNSESSKMLRSIADTVARGLKKEKIILITCPDGLERTATFICMVELYRNIDTLGRDFNKMRKFIYETCMQLGQTAAERVPSIKQLEILYSDKFLKLI